MRLSGRLTVRHMLDLCRVRSASRECASDVDSVVDCESH